MMRSPDLSYVDHGVHFGKPNEVHRKTSCLGEVFLMPSDWAPSAGYSGHVKEGGFFFALFNLDTNCIDVRVANWYLRHFVLANVPERLKKAGSIKRLTQKNFLRMCNTTSSVRPWIKLEVDTTKVCANDIYVLLALLRLPHEVPQCINQIYDLVKKGYPHDFSFMAGCANSGIADHAMSGIGIWSYKVPDLEKLKTWSLKERWEAVPQDLPFSKKVRRSFNCHQHFAYPICKPLNRNHENPYKIVDTLNTDFYKSFVNLWDKGEELVIYRDFR